MKFGTVILYVINKMAKKKFKIRTTHVMKTSLFLSRDVEGVEGNLWFFDDPPPPFDLLIHAY